MSFDNEYSQSHKCNDNWHILIYCRYFLALTHWANADQVVNLPKTNLWILMYHHLTSYQRTLTQLLKMSSWTNLVLFTNSKYDKCEIINQHRGSNKNFSFFFLFLFFKVYFRIGTHKWDNWQMICVKLVYLFCHRMNSIEMIKT